MPVFISYSSKDRRTALTICKALESRGQRCWISCRDVAPGDNFQESIVRALRGARVMLLIFSSNANNSEEIKKELVLAGRQHVTVIPVRVEDVVPNDAFAYEFATRQWIDLFQDWDREMETLSRQITQIQETASEGKPPENSSPPQPMPRDNSNRPVLIGAAALLLLAASGALAWFRPWATPSAPSAALSLPAPAAEGAKSAGVAATPPPPTAVAVPAPLQEKPAMPKASPRQALKSSAPVREATVAPTTALTAPGPAPSAEAPVATPAPAPPSSELVSSDDSAWSTAGAANTRDGFSAYLKAYPSGAHAGEAQLQMANLILGGPATGANFDGRWHTVWTCPNVGNYLGYSYQFDGQVSGGVYHGIKGNKGEPSSMVLDGKIDSDGAAAFTGEVIVGSSATGMGASRGTASDFHAAANFAGGSGMGRRLEGRGCTLSFSKS